MLTRLRVKGFKNLLDVDVRLGAFTCIAGLNGVGKSNLFDAIHFLRELTQKPFLEAAQSVRGGQEVRGLFSAGRTSTMALSADLLIAGAGRDDLGQPAKASATFVRYSVELAYEEPVAVGPGSGIQLLSEELTYIPKKDAKHDLAFPCHRDWLDSVVKSKRTAKFISTDAHRRQTTLHGDRPRNPGEHKGGGRNWVFSTTTLPRTVLSSPLNAQESQTAVLVRQALQNCRFLQLEPTALRRPDELRSEDRLQPDGSHLAATLYRLAHGRARGSVLMKVDAESVYATLANRLAELVQGVRGLRVDLDEQRKTLTVFLKELGGPELPAEALSDGTLRFLALAVLEMDPEERGVLCLEEPENGIHPQRIRAMLKLLQDIAVDPDAAVDDDNPLRQVILNTHSPAVVAEIQKDSLLFADSGNRSRGLRLKCIPGTWRSRLQGAETIPLGLLLSYLNPVSEPTRKKQRVLDFVKDEERQLSLCFEESPEYGR